MDGLSYGAFLIQGRKKPLTCRERPGWSAGFPTLLSTSGNSEIIRRTLCYGHRAAREAVWPEEEEHRERQLCSSSLICTSEVLPYKFKIINITYICKHQSHSTCLSHVTQSPGPWGHSVCPPVPSLLPPAESHSSQVNWGHYGDFQGAEIVGQPKLLLTLSISPCSLGSLWLRGAGGGELRVQLCQVC